MSVTRDDAGTITNLNTHGYGPRPMTRTTPNHRDASSATGGLWQRRPTPIQTPGRLGQNPFGNGRLKSNDGKAAASSSSQHVSKRQKLIHREEGTVSRYFNQPSPERRTRSQRSQAVLFPSPSRRSRAADAIIIDEDDISDVNDSSSKPVTLKTSSPDPMDIITPEPAYSFDQSKPSPMHQFGSSLEEMRRSPTDGESTARLRIQKRTEAQDPPSHPNGDSQSAKTLTTPRTAPSVQANVSPGKGNVSRLRTVYEVAPYEVDPTAPFIDLQARAQGRKNGMKPKQPQRQVHQLPLRLVDSHATRPSGFVSGSGPSKGRATRRGVVCNLPLEKWSIGVDIPPHEASPEPRANLTWNRDLLKVQHVDSSTLFELHLEKKSLKSVLYVDLKKSSHLEPLIQIHPLKLKTATIRHSTADGFKLGSPNPEGLLTFKFNLNTSDWDEKLYSELVQVLLGALVSKDQKSILDRAGAKAVWEAATRAHEDQLTRSGELESLPRDYHPKKAPGSVTKFRPRPKSLTEVAPTADNFVRRSARLSGVEQKRSSPSPDPDEVILAYRSGTGSLNITNGDVSRLKPGEFLNDTLIEFGLKLWLADLHESNPELAMQVHVFSSFFYKKLSTKIPEDGYNSVRKWTSKFDLFQKKYIIVPINENMHWYLAIIYFPEYTLLPRRSIQVANAVPRRSTRRLGVVVDCSGVKDSEFTPKQSLPPVPDPPPSTQADSTSRSGLLTPDSSRTDDQREEIDVERMVESGGPLPDLSVKQIEEQCVEVVDKGFLVDDAAGREDSMELLYPASSPHTQRAELPSSDHQDDVIVQEGCPVSRGASEGSGVRTSGISPANFYGTSDHKRRDVTTPEIALVDDGAPAEVVVEGEEDVVMGNPDSENEAVEHRKTHIFTFDSLSSKHPQVVKRLSKYLLMEAHDKKQRAEDTLTEPKGMQAVVPPQPNYCDCGIYLLHFAKTFMKDPKLSSEIIQNRSSPQRGRRVPHEHWDPASVVSYRDELAARINSLSDEWKRQRSEQDAVSRSQTEAAAPPQEQSSTDPTPAASSKADNDSDSEIEVLISPKKASPSKVAGSRKKGAATRTRG